MDSFLDGDQLNEDIEKLKQAALEENNRFHDPDDSDRDSNQLELNTEPDSDIVSLKSIDDVPVDDSNEHTRPLEVCLALNRQFQMWITNYISKVTLILDKNRARQEQVKNDFEDTANQKLVQKKKGFSVFAKPYFRDFHGSFPKPNADTIKKEAIKELYPFIRPAKIWSAEEKYILERSVKENRMKKLLMPYMNKKQLIFEKLKECAAGSEHEKDFMNKISEIDEEILRIKESVHYSVKYGDPDNLNDIDWMKIANVDLKGQKSAEACMSFWKNAGHPGISTCKWTAQEDDKLAMLAQQNKFRNWKHVADMLGTNRTAFMCLQRYQSKFNPVFQIKWTFSEDKKLESVIRSQLSTSPSIDWSAVSEKLKSRSEEECFYRWETLQPKVKYGGRWTQDLDKKLIDAVKLFGFNWNKIQYLIPGKNCSQCRDRFVNKLDGNLKNGKWTSKEDRLLWKAIKQFGLEGKWTKICQLFLPHRTDNQVYGRYKRLLMWEKIETNAKRRCRKILLDESTEDLEEVSSLKVPKPKILKRKNKLRYSKKKNANYYDNDDDDDEDQESDYESDYDYDIDDPDANDEYSNGNDADPDGNADDDGGGTNISRNKRVATHTYELRKKRIKFHHLDYDDEHDEEDDDEHDEEDDEDDEDENNLIPDTADDNLINSNNNVNNNDANTNNDNINSDTSNNNNNTNDDNNNISTVHSFDDIITNYDLQNQVIILTEIINNLSHNFSSNRLDSVDSVKSEGDSTLWLQGGDDDDDDDGTNTSRNNNVIINDAGHDDDDVDSDDEEVVTTDEIRMEENGTESHDAVDYTQNNRQLEMEIFAAINSSRASANQKKVMSEEYEAKQMEKIDYDANVRKKFEKLINASLKLHELSHVLRTTSGNVETSKSTPPITNNSTISTSLSSSPTPSTNTSATNCNSNQPAQPLTIPKPLNIKLNLPPLPPNFTTLQALLNLFNHRNALVRDAGIFQFPSKHNLPFPWQRTQFEEIVNEAHLTPVFEDEQPPRSRTNKKEDAKKKSTNSNAEKVVTNDIYIVNDNIVKEECTDNDHDDHSSDETNNNDIHTNVESSQCKNTAKQCIVVSEHDNENNANTATRNKGTSHDRPLNSNVSNLPNNFVTSNAGNISSNHFIHNNETNPGTMNSNDEDVDLESYIWSLQRDKHRLCEYDDIVNKPNQACKLYKLISESVEFQELQSRFNSLFLWPLMCSYSVEPSHSNE